jgi:hypothetical protein
VYVVNNTKFIQVTKAGIPRPIDCVCVCYFAGKPVSLPRSSRMGLANRLVDLAKQVGSRLYI